LYDDIQDPTAPKPPNAYAKIAYTLYLRYGDRIIRPEAVNVYRYEQPTQQE
jgi:hypothetical protein